MTQVIERMIREKNELEARIKKAKAVLDNIPFGMDETDVKLLGYQVKVMENYLSCLSARISYSKAKR